MRRILLLAVILGVAQPVQGAACAPDLPLLEASQCYREQAERPGADARLVNEYGFALFQLGRHRDAVDVFRRAVALAPAQAAYANNLGAAHLKLGEPVEAEAAFRAALRSDPASAKISYNIAVALFRQGRIRDAYQAYRQAEAVGAAYTKARFEREEVQRELREYVQDHADNQELQAVLRAAAGR